MSSEMRVTDEQVWAAVCAWRDVYDAEYIHSGSTMGNDEQAMRAALEAALLARTEAGAPHHPLAICPTCKDYYEVCECTPDAAPVADGAVAWRVEWDEDNDGDAFYVTLDTERGAMGRANEAIAEGFKGVRIRRLDYGDTHPQDASGDAEDAKRMDWLVANVTETLTAKSIRGEFPYPEHKTQYVLPRLVAWADFHGQVGFREAIDIAMQAKEAK